MGNNRYKITIYTEGSWKKYERHFFYKNITTSYSLVIRTTKLSYSYYLDRWHVFRSIEKLNTWSLEKNLQLRKALEPIMKRHYIPKKYDIDAVSLYELNCKCAFNFRRMCLYSKNCCFCRSFMATKNVFSKHRNTHKILNISFSGEILPQVLVITSILQLYLQPPYQL